MSELQSVARLKIHHGKLDEFKRLAAKCAELLAGPLGSFQEYGGHDGRDSSDMLWVGRSLRNA